LHLRKLADLDLENKRVLVRLDLNVPIQDGVIQDETRIIAGLETLKAILKKTRKVVVMSHLGRPRGVADKSLSLEPVGARLAELLAMEVVFIEDYITEPVLQVLDQSSHGQFILLENLRFHPGETKNDPEFARVLASGFDYFVNDAFGTLHRAHASVVGICEQIGMQNCAAGLLVEKEIAELSKLMSAPAAPFTVVMGGSKVSDKIAVTLSLLKNCNDLIVGGAMAYTFLKYKGFSVGDSKVEEDKLDLVEKIYENAEMRRVNIHLPVDHLCAREFSAAAEPIVTAGESISDGLLGLDIGPQTTAKYREVILKSATVLWNGPMGVFEWDSFAGGSLGVAAAMADCTGRTVVGGGDSVSAVNKAKLADKIDHISTGGGASLEFLEGKPLPGVRVLSLNF